MQGKWIRSPQGAASAVFVHGILSSGETCWRNDNGSYWPELLKNELELGSLGIYVFTYETGIFSGNYRLSDIVDALKEHMQLDDVLASDRLVFICHSMGGIVVTKFIVERAAELSGPGKEIDLFLVACPSLGASYADWLSPLAQLFGHAQADALRFVRNNNWLMDLDKVFKNLKERGKLKIKGKELVEDKFVYLPKFWRRQVVEPVAGARYFGEPYKVPLSDHFSIAKPDNKDAIQHRLLCQFIKNALSPKSEARNVHIKRGTTPPKPPTPVPAIPADISHMAVTVVPGSVLMEVTQRPTVAAPVVDGDFMTFPCQQGITISGRCKITGDPNDNPAGWTLGLIQLQWFEINWGSYRGQFDHDGSCLVQRARPPARAAQGCRDTGSVGEILVDNNPGLDRTVATGYEPFPIAMTAQFSDEPRAYYPLTCINSLTGKINFLREVQLEFDFCTILTLKDPAGNFRHLKHLLWNVHWQAQFRPTDFADIAADWNITLAEDANANSANVSNAGKAYNGGPTELKFTAIATDPSAPNCNEVASNAFSAPNTEESPVWHHFNVYK